jgi:hypothetical protein
MSKDMLTTQMTTAAEYRQFAEECLAAMRAAVIPEVRSALFIAAQRWNTLADEREEEALPSLARGLRKRHTADAGVPAQS